MALAKLYLAQAIGVLVYTVPVELSNIHLLLYIIYYISYIDLSIPYYDVKSHGKQFVSSDKNVNISAPKTGNFGKSVTDIGFHGILGYIYQ